MSANTRYAGLDLLRFVAACAVMAFHLSFLQWVNPHSAGAHILGDRAPYPGLLSFTWFGFIGVQVFFVISGFVIAFSASNAGPGRFLRSRFLRLYPAAIVCATLTVAAIMLVPDSHFSRNAYVRSIVLWPFRPWVDNVYWTLGVEMAFYALVLGHLVVRRFDWLEWTMTHIGAASCLAWGLNIAHVPLGEKLIHTRYGELSLAKYGVYFALGVLIWTIMIRGATLRRVATALLFTAAGAAFIGYGSISAAATFGHGLTASMALVPALFWLACVAGLVLAVRFDRQLPWSSRIATLGLATYPLYLIHYRVGAVVMRYLIDWGTPKDLALPITFLLMIAAAVALTLGPERIVRDRFASWLPKGGLGARETVAATLP